MKRLEIHNRVSEEQLAIAAGDRVVVTDDFGKQHDDVALDRPGKLAGHTWVVKLRDRGLYALCRVRPSPAPAFPRRASNGEKYGPAMQITDPTLAAEYFERLVEHAMRHGRTREQADEMERQNLAYYAGYYDAATRERVERLFRCQHPNFGAIAVNGQPGARAAIGIGVATAAALGAGRKGRS